MAGQMFPSNFWPTPEKVFPPLVYTVCVCEAPRAQRTSCREQYQAKEEEANRERD